MTQELLSQAVENYRLGKNQDEAARIIYDGTSRIALAVIMKHCSRTSEHEDILQITYMNVFNHLGDLKDPANLQAWVNQIAAHTAMRYGKQLHPELYQDVTDEEGNFPDMVDERETFQPGAFIETDAQYHAITEAMETLPQVQRDALLMLYAEGMSAKEAADRQGVSVNTIRSRAFQGRKKLEERKDIFRKYGVEVTAVPVALLIFSSFQRDVYAAECPAENAAVLNAARNGILKAMAPEPAKAGAAAKAGAEAAKINAGSGVKAGMAVKAGTGAGLGVKIAAGVVAAAVVVGGGAAAVSRVNNKPAAVQENLVNQEAVDAPVAAGMEQTETTLNYITLYATHLENGDGRENFTYTYEYEFSNDGKIMQLTEPISYRYGEGICGYQITEYDDHENELTETILEEDRKTVITYQNEYNGDLLIKTTAYRDDGTERIKRYEYDEDGVKVSQTNEWENEESHYERDKDGNLTKTITTKMKDEEVVRMVTTEYFYNENGARTSSIQTQENIKNGEKETDRIIKREYSYDESGMWRKQVRTNNGKVDLIYIDISQQYLFEHPDATVPEEFDFQPSSTAEIYSIAELEVMTAGDDEEITEDDTSASNDDESETASLPADGIGEDTRIKHITINDTELRLPMSVPDFLATGLELNGGRDYIEEDHYVIFNTPVEGGTLGILVVNPYHGLPEESAYWMDCYVSGVMYESSECNGEGFRTGNGLTGKNPRGTLGEILGPGGVSYGELYWKIGEGDKIHQIRYAYSDEGSSEPTSVFILFATFEDNQETEKYATEIYISNDGQTITIDRILSEVTINGYSEEGEFVITDYIFWMEGDDNYARRHIYNSSGEHEGHQDYLFGDGILTVKTYDTDYNYIGSFQDGEYLLVQD